MFNFFKKDEIEKSDILLLKSIFSDLPDEYLYLAQQLEDGILRKRRIGTGVIPNYIGFGYFPHLSIKFENAKLKSYFLEGFVFDKHSKRDIIVRVYVVAGLIAGYSTPNDKNIDLDANKINFKKIKKKYLENSEYKEIAPILNKVFKKNVINPSDVYKISIKENWYYNICDLEDGDFVGLGLDSIIYKITHDPFEINSINIDEALALIHRKASHSQK